MGKRSAVVELLLGNMGSMQWETRPSMQREDQPTMATKLEQIAVKARREPNLRFTSLAHHITRERVLRNLRKIPSNRPLGWTARRWRGRRRASRNGSGRCSTPSTAKDIGRRTSGAFISPSLARRKSVPLGCRPSLTGLSSAARLRCCPPSMSKTFCLARLAVGRELSAHHALATLNEVIAGGMTGWVLEADLKNFFGSLDHDWVLRFVEHRVGDPRLINLIRRWLKAGVLEDGAVHPSEEGTPQGGSISVLLSNLYLHHALDLWFERVVEVPVAGRSPSGALYR